MTQEDNKLWAQKKAVTLHDRDADWFNSQYNQVQDAFNSSFLCGRRQLEIHFKTLIDSLPNDAKILDVGCGTGDQMAQLIELGFDVTGVEPAEKMRKYAEDKLPKEAVKNGSVLALPFEDSSFDCIYSIEVFRYLTAEDNLKGFKEIHRVLKPGGVFFGTFCNLYALNGFAIVVAMRKLVVKYFGKEMVCHTDFTTPKKLEKILLSSGFSEVQTHGAMIGFLHIAYKLGCPIGKVFAKLLDPLQLFLTDTPILRPFAGLLIGIARKQADG